jgi:hypothetical protein
MRIEAGPNVLEIVGRGEQIDEATQNLGGRGQQHLIDEVQSVGKLPHTKEDGDGRRAEENRGGCGQRRLNLKIAARAAQADGGRKHRDSRSLLDRNVHRVPSSRTRNEPICPAETPNSQRCRGLRERQVLYEIRNTHSTC